VFFFFKFFFFKRTLAFFLVSKISRLAEIDLEEAPRRQEREEREREGEGEMPLMAGHHAPGITRTTFSADAFCLLSFFPPPHFYLSLFPKVLAAAGSLFCCRIFSFSKCPIKSFFKSLLRPRFLAVL